MNENVIRDVVTRTKGEVYVGVVGSVRSGKSTFIRRFMEKKVLPLIDDEVLYNKILDELPQSGDGKTIMTVEPKFVPSTNMKISTKDELSFSVRLVDCVGYVIPDAIGYKNPDGSSRLVRTPWYNDDIPFEEAATIGTEKVIESHSNIGILITSDGSFGDFTRIDYEQVEVSIIEKLKSLNKPFVIVINTKDPYSDKTNLLKTKLTSDYGVTTLAFDVENMNEDEIDEVLKEALNEFDIAEINFQYPDWLQSLTDNHSYKHSFNDKVSELTSSYRKMKDVFMIQTELKNAELFENVIISEVNPGTGEVTIDIECSDDAYISALEEIVGESLKDKASFITLLQDLIAAKDVYHKVGTALKMVESCGYGISIPSVNDMVLSTPELLKQGGRYGIKLKASAPAIQLVKIDVESSFEPIIGSMEQAQALIDHMLKDYEEHPEVLWNSEIFGRKLCDVISDGIKAKINAVPDAVQYKYKEAINKVVNSGKGGIIAIML